MLGGCRFGLLALSLNVAACGAARMDWVDWNAETAAISEQTASRFPGDAACFEGALHSGSRVTFRIVRETEGEAPDGWTLTLVAPLEAASGTDTSSAKLSSSRSGEAFTLTGRNFRGRIEIVDKDGGLEAQDASMPLDILSLGMWQSCAAFEGFEAGGELSDRARGQLLRGMAAGIALTSIVNQCPSAGRLAYELIQMPSWWTWLVPGLEIATLPNPVQAVPVTTMFGPGWRMPVEVRIKGDPAFYAQITCVEPRGVLTMTAGIIEVVGFAPDRPNEEVRMTLVDAAFARPGEPGEVLVLQAPLGDL